MWELARGRAWHGRWGPACTGPQVPSPAAGAGGRRKLERKAEAELHRACGRLRSLYLPEGIRKTLSSLIVSDLNFRKNLSAVVDLESEFR